MDNKNGECAPLRSLPGRTKATGPTVGVWKLVDNLDRGSGHSLQDQLRDLIAARKHVNGTERITYAKQAGTGRGSTAERVAATGRGAAERVAATGRGSAKRVAAGRSGSVGEDHLELASKAGVDHPTANTDSLQREARALGDAPIVPGGDPDLDSGADLGGGARRKPDVFDAPQVIARISRVRTYRRLGALVDQFYK